MWRPNRRPRVDGRDEDVDEEPSAAKRVAHCASIKENASTSQSSDEFLQGLICPLCCGVLTDPIRLLQCGHAFCANCLRHLPLAGGQQVPGLNYPQCWQFNPKPSGGWPIEKAIGITMKKIEEHQLELSSHPNRKLPGQGESIRQMCPHFPTPTSGHSTCYHCNRRFCSNCRPLHMKSIREEILKDAEKAIEESEHFSSEHVLKEAKRLIDESSVEAQRNLQNTISHIRAKLNKCLTDVAKDLSSKITNFSETSEARYERLVNTVGNKDHLHELKQRFNTISTRDVENLSLKGLDDLNCNISNRMRNLKKLELPSKGPLFKLKLDDGSVGKCQRTIEGLTLGKIHAASKLRSEVEPKVKEFEDASEEEDEDESEESSGLSSPEISAGNNSESEEEFCPSPAPVKPEIELEVVETQPPVEPVNPDVPNHVSNVAFEHKALSDSKYIVALMGSPDNEFVALHGSNQLALFNSKGFVCTMKLELAPGDSTSLEVDGIFQSKRTHLLATGTIGNTERKLFIVSILLKKGIARLYELVSSHNLEDFTSLLDLDSDWVCSTNASGVLSAYYLVRALQYHEDSNNSAIQAGGTKPRKVDIAQLSSGCRLLSCVGSSYGVWSIVFSVRQEVSCVDVIMKPHINKQFVLGTIQPNCFPIKGGDSVVFKTYDYNGTQMVLTKGPLMQIFDVSISPDQRKCSVKKSATYQLPFAHCSNAAFLDRKIRENFSLLQSLTYQPESSPTVKSQPSMAVFSNKGSVTLIPFPTY